MPEQIHALPINRRLLLGVLDDAPENRGRDRLELDFARNLRRDQDNALFVRQMRPGFDKVSGAVARAVQQQDRRRRGCMRLRVQEVLIVGVLAMHGP